MMIPGGILRVAQLYQAYYQTRLAKFIVQMPACVYQMYICNPPFEIPVCRPPEYSACLQLRNTSRLKECRVD